MNTENTTPGEESNATPAAETATGNTNPPQEEATSAPVGETPATPEVEETPATQEETPATPESETPVGNPAN